MYYCTQASILMSKFFVDWLRFHSLPQNPDFFKASDDDKVNFLANYKVLELSEFKAFADNKINMIPKQKFVHKRVENIVGKGENAGYQHFLLFPQCFQKLSFQEVLKVSTVWYTVNLAQMMKISIDEQKT